MKTTVALTLDLDIVGKVRKEQLNLSKLVNDFLREHLQIPELEKPKSLIQTENDIVILESRLADLRGHHRKISKTAVIIE